jgi:hypothetical protein
MIIVVDREHQRVAVGCGAFHFAGRDRAAGAGFVLHHPLLAGLLLHVLAVQAREDVGLAAGGVAHHHADRFARPSLSACLQCEQRQRGHGAGVGQHATACEAGLHRESPRLRQSTLRIGIRAALRCNPAEGIRVGRSCGAKENGGPWAAVSLELRKAAQLPAAKQ